jgi:branched-chain amino acid transport system permease protein
VNFLKNSIILILIVIILFLLPFLKVSDYIIVLMNEIIVWGLFALAFNLLFGVTGMLSFGQALFYGFGAYVTGLLVVHFGASWFIPSIMIGMTAVIFVSFLLGLITIRLSGVYFTILTLAFAQLGWDIVFKWYSFTGGDDGIQGIYPPDFLGSSRAYYFFSLILIVFSVWVIRKFVNSPYGLTLKCLRQNPIRMSFLGRKVRNYQLGVYVVSGIFSSLAGSLMAGINGSIHPGMLNWTTSGEVILMSVLGGIGQFFGPFLGAGVIVLIEDIIGAYTEYWSFIIGLIMLIIVLAFPKGVLGEFSKLRRRLKF